jgi:uncharacterized membrane protein
VPMDEERLATALGWFSIGLGLAEVVAPGSVARLVGVRDDDRNRWALRALGVREVVNGVGILSQPRSAGWLWARVGGDLMDLAYLGTALKSRDAEPGRVGAAMAAVAGVTALDVLCAERLSADSHARPRSVRAALMGKAPREHPVHVRKSITVGRPAEELYRFWRDFHNLPRFMRHLESVQVIDERRSHWKAKAPFGRTIEWDAEIIEEGPNELIAWRSLEGADLPNYGAVTFEPARAAAAPSSGWTFTTSRLAASSARPSPSCWAKSPGSRCRRICARSSNSWRPARSCTRRQASRAAARRKLQRAGPTGTG